MVARRLTRSESQARTRGALIDAAAVLFGRRGYDATSVEAIAQIQPSKFTFPVRGVVRLDFPARGGMAPVKVFFAISTDMLGYSGHDTSREELDPCAG